MKHWLVAAAFLTVPAMAQEPSTVEQYLAAKEAFLGGEEGLTEYMLNYRKHLFDGIEGHWYAISILDPDTDDADPIAQTCERLPLRIKVKNEYTLEFVLNEGKETEMTTVYSSRSGSTFGQHVDPAELIRRLGLDRVQNAEQPIMSALSNSNGLATIVRPSPDIIVVQVNYAVPTIFGRCPTT